MTHSPHGNNKAMCDESMSRFEKALGIHLTAIQRSMMTALHRRTDERGQLVGVDVTLNASTGHGKTLMFAFMLWLARDLGTRVKAIVACDAVRCDEIAQFLKSLGFRVMRLDEDGCGNTHSRAQGMTSMKRTYYDDAEVLVVAFTMMTAAPGKVGKNINKATNTAIQPWILQRGEKPGRVRSILDELLPMLTLAQQKELKELTVHRRVRCLHARDCDYVLPMSPQLAGLWVDFMDRHRLPLVDQSATIYQTLLEHCTGFVEATGSELITGFGGRESPINFIVCDEDPRPTALRKLMQVALRSNTSQGPWGTNAANCVSVLIVSAKPVVRSLARMEHIICEPECDPVQAASSEETTIGRDFHPHASGEKISLRELCSKIWNIQVTKFDGAGWIVPQMRTQWNCVQLEGVADSKASVTQELEHWAKTATATAAGRVSKPITDAMEIIATVLDNVPDHVASFREWTSMAQHLHILENRLTTEPWVVESSIQVVTRLGSPADKARARRYVHIDHGDPCCIIEQMRDQDTPGWIRAIYAQLAQSSTVLLAGKMPIASRGMMCDDESGQDLARVLRRYPTAGMTHGRVEAVQFLVASSVGGLLHEILRTHCIAEKLLQCVMESVIQVDVKVIKCANNKVGAALTKALLPSQNNGARIVLLPPATYRGLDALNVPGVRLLLGPYLTSHQIVQLAGRINRISPLHDALSGTRHVTMLRLWGTGCTGQLLHLIRTKQLLGLDDDNYLYCEAKTHFPHQMQILEWSNGATQAERELAANQRVVQVGDDVTTSERTGMPKSETHLGFPRTGSKDEKYACMLSYINKSDAAVRQSSTQCDRIDAAMLSALSSIQVAIVDDKDEQDEQDEKDERHTCAMGWARNAHHKRPADYERDIRQHVLKKSRQHFEPLIQFLKQADLGR